MLCQKLILPRILNTFSTSFRHNRCKIKIKKRGDRILCFRGMTGRTYDVSDYMMKDCVQRRSSRIYDLRKHFFVRLNSTYSSPLPNHLIKFPLLLTKSRILRISFLYILLGYPFFHPSLLLSFSFVFVTLPSVFLEKVLHNCSLISIFRFLPFFGISRPLR